MSKVTPRARLDLTGCGAPAGASEAAGGASCTARRAFVTRFTTTCFSWCELAQTGITLAEPERGKHERGDAEEFAPVSTGTLEIVGPQSGKYPGRHRELADDAQRGERVTSRLSPHSEQTPYSLTNPPARAIRVAAR